MSLYRLLPALIVCICLSISQNAFAAGSGGLRDETPDAGVFGKGSAFVGQADTPAAVYYNPAGLNQISTTEVTLGAAVIAPRGGQFKDLSGNTTNMRNNEFVVPDFFAVVPIIKNKLTLGLGGGSYWGLGSEWAADSFARYSSTKTTLANTDTLFTMAYQVTDQWSVALSADNDYSKLDENKKFDNQAGSDGNVALKAKDDAWGWRAATMFKINAQNQIGIMYRSPIAHNYIGKIYVDNAGGYAGLFGNNPAYETRFTEKVTLPQSVVLGYSFKPTSRWTLDADLEWMDWASVKNQTFNYPDASSNALLFLSNGNPVSEDWTAAWSEAIGAEYKATDKLRLRTGYYHHQEVGPQDNYNPGIPDMGSDGFTVGFGYDITRNLTIDVAYSYIYYEPRKINTSLSSGMDNGTYSEDTDIGMVSLTYKF